MKTQPLVDFALYDPTIKPDSNIAVQNDEGGQPDIISYAKADDLKQAGPRQLVASFEPDFWLLDGSIKLLPEDTTNVHAGWVSNKLSDSAGDFTGLYPPSVQAWFGSAHDLTGLTLTFSASTGEWATHVRVRFQKGVTYEDYDYYPTGPEFYVAQAVAGVTFVWVAIKAWNKPYRRVRLQSIDYGKIVHFTGADIKNCKVIEEIDPLSTTLPIGTLELTLHTEQADFSIVNPAGDYADLESRQPLDVYEQVGADRVYIGHFFLDDWENLSEKEIRFRAVDWIGMLDKIPFIGDQWDALDDTQTPALVLGPLFDANGIPYTIEADWASDNILGYCPRGTLRDLVQYLCNAFGATARCARSSQLNLLRIGLPVTNTYGVSLSTEDYHITVAEKGADQTLSLLPQITRVEVTGWESWELPAGVTAETLYDSTRSPGTYLLLVDKPYIDWSVTGGTIVASGRMYCSYSVAVTGTVTIRATPFAVRKSLTSADLVVDPPVPHVLAVTENPMINGGPYGRYSMNQVVTRLATFYGMRYLQKMKAFTPPYTVGNSLLIDTQGGRQIWALVEKMTLDLSGGFVAQVEAVGVVKTL